MDRRRKVVIRTDISKRTGIGHLIRCLNLAQAFRKRGYRCLFLIKGKDARPILAKSGFRFSILSENLKPAKEIDFLGSLLGREKADILITDSYNIDDSYIHKIKPHTRLVVRIDDRLTRRRNEGLLINQSRELNGKRPRKGELIGSRYAIINDRFMKPDKRRTIRSRAGRIMVSIGGSDLRNQTKKVLKALLTAEKPLKINIITGYLSNGIKDIRALAKDKRNIRIISKTDSMADYMLKSDIAVCAGGTTLWETCCTGLPTISITVADNQSSQVRYLSKKGAICSLGWYGRVREADIKRAVSLHLRDRALRARMSVTGKRIVDGKGKERILKAVESLLKGEG